MQGFSRINPGVGQVDVPMEGFSRINLNPGQVSVPMDGLTLNGLGVVPARDGGWTVVSMQGYSLNGAGDDMWMTEEEYDLWLEAVDEGDEDATMDGLKDWFKRIKENRRRKKELKFQKKEAKIGKIYAKADSIRERGTVGQMLAGAAGNLINAVTGQEMDSATGEIIGDVPTTVDELDERGLFNKPWYNKPFKKWPMGAKVGVPLAGAVLVGAGVYYGTGQHKKRKKRRR